MGSPLQSIGKRVDDFVYTKAIELLGGGAEAYARLAARHESLGWWEEAVEAHKKAIKLRPHQAVFRLKLADVYCRLERFDEAMALCEEALELDKNLAPAHVLRGVLCQRTGRNDEAAVKPQNASFHRHLGDVYRQVGRYTEASRAYWQAIHLNPQDGMARYGLGVTYVRLDQRPYALEQKAVLKTIDPKLAAELDHVIWRLTRTPKA